MRLFHYLEIRNFKCFGDRQRIELDHPTVLIGPNNCGKTTAIQAIALWSQAVRTWHGSKGNAPPRERTSTSLNRLNLVSVPVQRTRYFWHNTVVRKRNADIPLVITLGVLHENRVEPVTMRFRNQGEELIYCTPDEETLARPALIEAAARVNVDLLYPMSGLETEEPILQPGRIDVLLGQGQTAQTLRNLCLMVLKNTPGDWKKITKLTKRLFSVDLGDPRETARGAIDLLYRQPEVKEPLDIALAGRGLQQMLLIFAYLYSHRPSVLLIDEPDAHLEILRQKQVYVLLREIAHENGSQVILVTHSEVILEEALDRNLTLLLDGRADDLAAKAGIRNALKHYGTAHYVRARQRGYVLYVEGRTDLDILQALARRLDHPVADAWDDRINAFNVQDNFPGPDAQIDSEIERVEGGFGVTPERHFFALREMLPGLRGLAILDSDRGQGQDTNSGGLRIRYWRRYEIENYFITPAVLKRYARNAYSEPPLFAESFAGEIDEVLDALILERVFSGRTSDFATWQGLDADAARLLWEASTERIKLSDFAEAFFRRLAERLGHAMLLRKGDLHQLVDFVDPRSIPTEVSKTLDLLKALFDEATPGEGA
ncbi:MAG: ATP-binding protein [Thiotrichales bacterium]|nr:ATP-binding protein [Thiotrichales bacterium]MCY4349921.1 ATP-binding protein [Thiotrichales bacterium]